MTDSRYFMDDPREAQRLAEKVDPDGWVKRYLSPLLLRGHPEVLDVGCGPGVIARAVARLHPHAAVTGLDLCAERFGRTQTDPSFPANVNLQAGNALELPFEAARFDLAYCRFLLEYLPERQRAVDQMVRVCKPGARVVLQDLDGQLVWHHPQDRELQSMVERVLEGLANTGFDPFVGRKLFSLARAAGLGDIAVSVEGYHLIAGAVDEHTFRLWQTKLEIAMPVAAKVLGSESLALQLRDRFLDYLKRDDTLTYSVVFTVTGTKCAGAV